MNLRKFSLGMVGIALYVLPANAFELVSSLSDSIEPVLEVARDDSGITVNYSFPGAYQSEDDLYPGTYRLAIPGFGFNMNPGEPAWLQRWDTFEIPEGFDPSVQILSTESTDISISLAPAREDLINNSDEVYSLDNVPAIQSYSGWLPEKTVKQGDIKVYRDRNILYIATYPISYNYRSGVVRAVDRLSYRINFVTAKRKISSEANSRERLAVDYDYISSLFTNVMPKASEEEKTLISTQSSSNGIWMEGEGYLILSCKKYSTAVKKFADWKNIMGYNVKIVYADDWTPSKIKQTIAEYNNPLFNYLLLFGDEIDLPGELHTADYPFYTDYFYACLNGDNDDLPDVAYGRISVTSIDEANTIVDKIIDYEKLSHISKDVLHCAEFSDYYYTPSDGYEDRAYTKTSENIATGIIAEGKNVIRVYNYKGSASPTNWAHPTIGNGDPIPDFMSNNDFNWKGNNSDITAAINSGILYAFHRDHGDIQKWANPLFTNADVNSLTNGKHTPVIFSINCLTGMYQYYPMPQKYDAPNDLVSSGRSTCLAEAFIRKQNGGAVAVIAASQLSATYCNEAFVMEMFQLIWPTSKFCYPSFGYTPSVRSISSKPIRNLGKLLNSTKTMVSTTFEGYGKNRCLQIYHCFGDPSMEIKDILPVSPSVLITNIGSSQQVNQSYMVEIPPKYKLVRIPNRKGTVVYGQQERYELTLEEISNYKYYVVGDNIKPTPLSDFQIQTVSNEMYGIKSILQIGDQLTVSYLLPNNDSYRTISIRNILTSSSTTVTCDSQQNTISIDISGLPKGVYIVELHSDNRIIETTKTILK